MKAQPPFSVCVVSNKLQGKKKKISNVTLNYEFSFENIC